MTSDVNKWRDVKQSLRQSSVLPTFLYLINRLLQVILVIALSINPQPFSAQELKLSDLELILGTITKTVCDNL